MKLSAHFSNNGTLFKVNAEQQVRNKSVGVKAIFEEEFRFYSSQPSPAREERVLDGSKVWLLLSVWNFSKRGTDSLLGQVDIPLTSTAAVVSVMDSEWLTLLDADGQAVKSNDGEPARVAVSVRYCQTASDSSFSTLC